MAALGGRLPFMLTPGLTMPAARNLEVRHPNRCYIDILTIHYLFSVYIDSRWTATGSRPEPGNSAS
jgi:hypothetical protein